MKIDVNTELEHRIIGALMDALLDEPHFVKTEYADGYQYVYVNDPEEPNGIKLGWVCLTRGNGADVITDYSVNLKKTIRPALELADLYR